MLKITNIYINSCISDPRNQSIQRQPSSAMPPSVMTPTGVPPPDPRYTMAMAAAAANGGQNIPLGGLTKKGSKALPHRPGALPMPPGMDIRGMLNDNASSASSSLNDSSRRGSKRLVSVFLIN